MDVSILSVHLGKIQFAQLSGSTGVKLPPPVEQQQSSYSAAENKLSLADNNSHGEAEDSNRYMKLMFI